MTISEPFLRRVGFKDSDGSTLNLVFKAGSDADAEWEPSKDGKPGLLLIRAASHLDPVSLMPQTREELLVALRMAGLLTPADVLRIEGEERRLATMPKTAELVIRVQVDVGYTADQVREHADRLLPMAFSTPGVTSPTVMSVKILDT